MGSTTNTEEDNKGGRVRSKSSSVPSYVRFYNTCKCAANIFWLDYNGKKKLYNRLSPGEVMDINTFVSHPWVFENSETGDHLLARKQEVFYPESWAEEVARVRRSNPLFQGTVVRKFVPITYPLYTLQEKAMQIVRDHISNPDDVSKLEIPLSVKCELYRSFCKKLFSVSRYSP